MRITLMRHGKPALLPTGRISARDFQHWIATYNQAPLAPQSQPSLAVLQLLEHNPLIVCSQLRRSLDSAALLGCTQPDYCDHQLREMEIPHTPLVLPKLAPNYWAIGFRMAWLLGFARNSESLKEAKLRAQAGAKQLIGLAQQHQRNVVFIGHGMLNRFIAKEFSALGWRGPKNPGSHYWSFASYEKIE